MPLESESGLTVPDAYTLIRNSKKMETRFLTKLQGNDLAVVNDDQHPLRIKFADGSEEVITAKNSPYMVPSKGEVKDIWTNGNVFAGRIEDFDGNTVPLKTENGLTIPAAYTLIRNNKKVEIEFLTELQTGDLIVVNDHQHFLRIKLGDGSEEVITAKNSPYVAYSKGVVPTLAHNIWPWVVRLTERQGEITAVALSTK